jgi:hypothetical protein
MTLQGELFAAERRPDAMRPRPRAGARRGAADEEARLAARIDAAPLQPLRSANGAANG